MFIKSSFRTCLFLLTLQTLSAQSGVPYGKNPQAGKYLVANGVRLYYEIYGAGQPLLLLHGNGGSIGSRRNEIPWFSQQYMVIAIDSRCHGKSACMSGDLDYETMAADINALLDSLKIDSCLIWGHSDGGILGLIMGYTYPAKVKKLITTGANVLPDSSAIFPELMEMVSMYPDLPDTMMAKHFKLLAQHPNIPYQRLRDIKAPVLVMAGDRDAIREEHTVRIFQSIPNAQMCILPGTTHFLANENPELFRMIAQRFFEKPFAKPSTVQIMQEYAKQLKQQAKH